MGAYRDLIASNAEFSLADALDDAENSFADEFKDYWGLDAAEPPEGVDLTEWRDLRQLYGLAQQVAEVASSLLKRKGLGAQRLAQPSLLHQEARAFQSQIDDVLKLVRERFGIEGWGKAYWKLKPSEPSDPRTRRGVFQNSLEIATSRLFLPQLDAVVARVQALLSYLVTAQNARAIAFLAHVARCYCLDQRTELAVMCRAVLDVALQDIAQDEKVREKLGGKPNERVGLSKRIDYIVSLGLVDNEALQAMRRIKKAGDDAIHVAPGLEPEPDALLADLVTAITAIEAGR